jgi:hypothetical protein
VQKVREAAALTQCSNNLNTTRSRGPESCGHFQRQSAAGQLRSDGRPICGGNALDGLQKGVIARIARLEEKFPSLSSMRWRSSDNCRYSTVSEAARRGIAHLFGSKRFGQVASASCVWAIRGLFLVAELLEILITFVAEEDRLRAVNPHDKVVLSRTTGLVENGHNLSATLLRIIGAGDE